MDHTPTTPTSPSNRPRPHSRGISFRSDKSGGSEGRQSKLIESPREKAQRDSIWKGNSKSNPNAAINEAQPVVANLTEQSTLQNLREFDHRDASGNVIVDPDRSNPTRPRMERPLDTIRSFERAIDDGYRRRTSYMRQDSENWDRDNQFASRRSSGFFGSNESGPSPQRPMQNGGGGYYGGQGQGYYNGPPRARYGGGNRMASDPQLYGQRPYQQHGHHQSYDTVNTGTNGSDSTGPWANSTDPSSENSSIDKVNAMNKPVPPMDPYGQHGPNGYNATIMEEHSAGMYWNYWQANENGQANGYPLREDHGSGGFTSPRDIYARANSSPMVQQPQASQAGQARRPIQLGGGGPGDYPTSRPPANLPPQTRKEPEKEKRQSWLKRRFSKKT